MDAGHGPQVRTSLRISLGVFGDEGQDTEAERGGPIGLARKHARAASAASCRSLSTQGKVLEFGLSSGGSTALAQGVLEEDV